MKHRSGKYVLGIAMALALVVSGCGKVAEKAGEKAAEKAAEAASGGDADVDIKDDKVNIKTDDGSASYGTEIPKSWPDDIPLPDDFKPTGGSEVNQGDDAMVIVVGTTKDSFDDVKSFYKDKLSGWKEVVATTMNSDPPVFSATYELNDRTVQIAVSDNGDSRDLSLTHMQGPAN